MASEPIGRRLLPAIIDDYAKNKPNRVYASVPVCQHDLTKGYKDFTYAHFARAINAAAHWLDKTLGKSSGTFETFMYLGARDLRYAILTVAAAKTGRKTLFPSLFGSMESHVFLAAAMDCQHIVHSKELEELAYEIREQFPQAPCFLAPGVDEWLHEHESSVPDYPWTKTFDEVEWDPVYIVHTSGTTGLPKPVVYTHGHIAQMDDSYHKPPINGRKIAYSRLTSGRFYSSLPVFHMAGNLTTLVIPVFLDMVPLMGPADCAPTPAMASQILRHGNVISILFAPFLIEALGRNPETMAQLKRLQVVAFAGAPLAASVGDELSRTSGLTLMNGIGNTEAGVWLTLETDREDWQYFMFHPEIGIEFEQQDLDGDMYEFVVHRSPAGEKCSNFWRTFPHETVIHTKDLFSKHPTKPNLWKYRCRLDDLILLTGEIKLYCRTIEEAVACDPRVKDVLVGGDGRAHPFMLVERNDDVFAGDDAAFLDDIWPTVEMENARNAPSARIRRSMTLVMGRTNPLIRAPKGSVERRRTFATYQTQIDGLYGGAVGLDAASEKTRDSGTEFELMGGKRVPGTEDMYRTVD